MHLVVSSPANLGGGPKTTVLSEEALFVRLQLTLNPSGRLSTCSISPCSKRHGCKHYLAKKMSIHCLCGTLEFAFQKCLTISVEAGVIHYYDEALDRVSLSQPRPLVKTDAVLPSVATIDDPIIRELASNEVRTPRRPPPPLTRVGSLQNRISLLTVSTLWYLHDRSLSDTLPRRATRKEIRKSAGHQLINFLGKAGHGAGGFSLPPYPPPSPPPSPASLQQIGANVFVTDKVLALLMASTRSIYSWDVVAEKFRGKMFLYTRDGAPTGLLSPFPLSCKPEQYDFILDLSNWFGLTRPEEKGVTLSRELFQGPFHSILELCYIRCSGATAGMGRVWMGGLDDGGGAGVVLA